MRDVVTRNILVLLDVKSNQTFDFRRERLVRVPF